MKNFISILTIYVAFLGSSYGQSTNDYSRTLSKMFEVSGSEESYKTVINQLITLFRDQTPNVDEKFWKEFEKELSKTSVNDLVTMLVPVYEKYMTQADLEEMIKFYQSPTGQKFAKSTPLIMQESMQIGQEWGKQLGEKVQQKLKEKGY